MTKEQLFQQMKEIISNDPGYKRMLDKVIDEANARGITLNKKQREVIQEKAMLLALRNNETAKDLMAEYMYYEIREQQN